MNGAAGTVLRWERWCERAIRRVPIPSDLEFSSQSVSVRARLLEALSIIVRRVSARQVAF
jgi:hypothetical protein